MNTDQARLFQGLSSRAKRRREAESLLKIERKRLALIESMAGDEQEREALGLLSYGHLVCLINGTPPTLPLTMEQAHYIQTGFPRGTDEEES